MKNYAEKYRNMNLRFDHVLSWIDELAYWLDRESIDIPDWKFSSKNDNIKDLHIKLGDKWPGSDDLVIFETIAKIKIPNHWDLENTRLYLDTDGESLATISYNDGSYTSCGLNPFHHTVILDTNEFSIKVESVARDLFGIPKRDTHLKEARIILLEPKLYELLKLMRTTITTAKALDNRPEIQEELMERLEYLLAHLDWPTKTENFLPRIVNSSRNLMREKGTYLTDNFHGEQEGIWQLPAQSRNKGMLEPLEDQHIQSVESSFKWLTKELKELKAKFPKSGKVMVSGHAHLDYVWLWPQTESERKIQRTMSSVNMLANKYKNFIYNQSQAALLEHIEEQNSELFEDVRSKVKSGQIELIGGMWVETDTNMPSAEAFNRQFLYGQQYFMDKFNVKCSTAWLPDTFGFSGSLPQLFKSAGLTNMVTIKVNWNEANKMTDNMFWWKGDNGDKVFVHTFNVFEGYNMPINATCINEVWQNFQNKSMYDETIASFGFGDGGGGPSYQQIEEIEQINKMPAIPEVRTGKVQEFMSNLESEAKTRNFNTWTGEIYLEYHRATLTSQSAMKKKNRLSEHALVNAETLQTLDYIQNKTPIIDMSRDWKFLLRNQFHDALPGSSIGEVYAQTDKELTTVIDNSQAKIHTALDNLSKSICESGDKKGVFVVNQHLNEINGLQLVSPDKIENSEKTTDGYIIALDSKISGLEAKFIPTSEDNLAKGKLIATKNTLENDFIKVTIDESGRISSLFDKIRNRESLSAPANQLKCYFERPRTYDAWDMEANYKLSEELITDVKSIELIEKGKMRIAIKVSRKIHNSYIEQTYILWSNSARLDIKTKINWNDRRRFLRSEFPIDVHTDYATYDQAIGVIRRSTEENTPWDRAKFEGSAHKFVDLSETGFGVSLITKDKYGFSVTENVIGASFVRGPTFPDPICDEGEQEFTHSLYPHNGAWSDVDNGVVTNSIIVNDPLIFKPTSAKDSVSKQFVTLKGIELNLCALKQAEDKQGLILRAYEPYGKRGICDINLSDSLKITKEVNTLEENIAENIAENISHRELNNFTPFKLKTYYIK